LRRDATKGWVREPAFGAPEAAHTAYRLVSFPDQLTLESRLLRARSGHAQVEIQ